MDAEAFRGWLERYFAAWASNDPTEVEPLFAEDAVYVYGPFRDDDAHGRDEIVRRWIEGVELDGILVLDFDGGSRCTRHREWYHRRGT